MKGVVPSGVLVSSLWRVVPITLLSQADMPSLTTVTLDKKYAFTQKKRISSSNISYPFYPYIGNESLADYAPQSSYCAVL